LGFGVHYTGQKLRLFGINAYEVSLRGGTTPEEKAKGIEARDLLRKMLPEGTEILVETIKDGKGKYGRYLANVWIPQSVCSNVITEGTLQTPPIEGVMYLNLNKWLVHAGYAIEKDY
jgi:endonuclease YncB( thermonuclease family)